ncbi:MAG: hypothetical protein EZS28_010879 [Streblomastix strix]|uniref:Peptidase C1A papain C-terminal domain-containing protein n=1 Tax=Streblomastix strix TaxID=222440 RepID=A0A5J4WF34_9EUKA|nr:MAG: hypothetical protein EZS28_010879 [Streblomastix strix]
MIAHASLIFLILVANNAFARLTFHLKVNTAQLPDTFDWRSESSEAGTAFTSVLDQKNCGGCWAFSTVDSAGAWLQLQTNGTNETVQAPMSPQHQLDCDKRRISYFGEDVTQAGCNGGLILTSFRELALELGSLEDQCQPFIGIYKKWSNETNYFRPINFWVFDYDADIDYKSVGKKRPPYYQNAQYVWPLVRPSHITDAFKEIIYNCGPSSVSFQSCHSFQQYRSGSGENISIYEENNDEMMLQNYYGCGGHAVTIYGWGVKNDQEYWIVKNSWGPSFGDRGFFYIRAGLEDYDFEQEISSFCPKDVFFSDSVDEDGEMEFGFYDWTLQNGTHIDFIRNETGDEPWVVYDPSVIEEPSEDGDLFNWTVFNMGLLKGTKLGIFGTLLFSSLFSQFL